MRASLLLALALTGTSHAASFNCHKASTWVEQTICANATLSKLDEALANNYQMMRDSDIGDGARQYLRETQRNWLKERNRCTTPYCIKAMYYERVDAVCALPVITGVHPLCVEAADIE